MRSLYEEPHNPLRPKVCFDEVLYQPVAQTRTPFSVRPVKPARYDYEYKRSGTCNLFICFEFERGWREMVEEGLIRRAEDPVRFWKPDTDPEGGHHQANSPPGEFGGGPDPVGAGDSPQGYADPTDESVEQVEEFWGPPARR